MGGTARQFNKMYVDYKKRFKKPIQNIAKLMPQEFSDSYFVETFKRLYPDLWEDLNKQYKYWHDKNDVLIEVRATDFLFEYGESNPIESRYSAVATYCAKDRGKFWEFYDAAITKVWNEWFKESGKSAFSEFNRMGKDYWINIGKDVGLDDDFAECVESNETLEAVKADAKKMAKYVNGLPYFKFNSYVLSGFDLSWGWDQVLMYFDAGLRS